MVLTILALLTAIAVPRFTSVDRRKAQAGLDHLEDMLTVFAYRDSLGTQRLGLGPNPLTGTIDLLIKEFDPEDPVASGEWLPDRLVQPVDLPPNLQITEVLVDGRAVDLDNWFIATVPGSDRPSIRIFVEGPEISAELRLEPYMMAPVVIQAGRDTPPVRLPVDLDQTGLDRGTW